MDLQIDPIIGIAIMLICRVVVFSRTSSYMVSLWLLRRTSQWELRHRSPLQPILTRYLSIQVSRIFKYALHTLSGKLFI